MRMGRWMRGHRGGKPGPSGSWTSAAISRSLQLHKILGKIEALSYDFSRNEREWGGELDCQGVWGAMPLFCHPEEVLDPLKKDPTPLLPTG